MEPEGREDGCTGSQQLALKAIYVINLETISATRSRLLEGHFPIHVLPAHSPLSSVKWKASSWDSLLWLPVGFGSMRAPAEARRVGGERVGKQCVMVNNCLTQTNLNAQN
jgi:hypothetical protein